MEADLKKRNEEGLGGEHDVSLPADPEHMTMEEWDKLTSMSPQEWLARACEKRKNDVVDFFGGLLSVGVEGTGFLDKVLLPAEGGGRSSSRGAGGVTAAPEYHLDHGQDGTTGTTGTTAGAATEADRRTSRDEQPAEYIQFATRLGGGEPKILDTIETAGVLICTSRRVLLVRPWLGSGDWEFGETVAEEDGGMDAWDVGLRYPSASGSGSSATNSGLEDEEEVHLPPHNGNGSTDGDGGSSGGTLGREQAGFCRTFIILTDVR